MKKRVKEIDAMKILWFPRLQPDINKLHLTTWRGMCKELESSGCTIKVALTGKDTENILERKCIEIYLIRKKFFRLLSFWVSGYMKFIYHFLTFKPDIVIFDIYSIWFSIPFIFFRNRRTVYITDERTPFFNVSPFSEYTIQDKMILLYTKLSYWFTKNNLDGMTVITTHFKEHIHKKFNVPLDFMDVWGSGVDINIFSPQGYDEFNELSFLKGKFVLFQHGEFSDNRGLLETIEAVQLTGRKDIHMVLIGEGKKKEDILRKIQELELTQNIHVLPPKPHSAIPQYLTYCDCAVMAYPDIEYWNNNNPIKLLEYLAMGKMVICTDMWTFRNVAGNSKCAYYINNNKPETIANAIAHCYENKKLLIEWGKEGIDIVKDKYTWHRQALNLLNFLDRLKLDTNS